MSAFLRQSVQEITTYLQAFVATERAEQPDVLWKSEVFGRLDRFLIGGKLIRGSLARVGYQLAGGQTPAITLPLSGSLELMQSCLLIHDDFMDKDELRRGEPSMPQQFRTVAQQQGYADWKHVGDSYAICVGDILMFMAVKSFNHIKAEPAVFHQMLEVYMREYLTVGLAQMQDLHQAHTDQSLTIEQVLEVYRYKTGRYSIAVPLMLGAMLGNGSAQLVQQVEALGELLGLVFQLKDDEIATYGTTAVTGKPVGNDIKEGKKTLYYLFAYEQATLAQRQQLDELYQASQITQAEVRIFQDILAATGAKAKQDTLIEQYQQQALKLVDDLSTSQANKDLLRDLIDLQLKRKK